MSCATVNSNSHSTEIPSKLSTSHFRTLTNNEIQALSTSNIGYEPQEKCFNDTVVKSWPLNQKQKQILDLHEEDSCLKSCSTDCILSEWGEWSECHGKCIGAPTGNLTPFKSWQLYYIYIYTFCNYIYISYFKYLSVLFFSWYKTSLPAHFTRLTKASRPVLFKVK